MKASTQILMAAISPPLMPEEGVVFGIVIVAGVVSFTEGLSSVCVLTDDVLLSSVLLTLPSDGLLSAMLSVVSFNLLSSLLSDVQLTLLSVLLPVLLSVVPTSVLSVWLLGLFPSSSITVDSFVSETTVVPPPSAETSFPTVVSVFASNGLVPSRTVDNV